MPKGKTAISILSKSEYERKHDIDLWIMIDVVSTKTQPGVFDQEVSLMFIGKLEVLTNSLKITNSV